MSPGRRVLHYPDSVNPDKILALAEEGVRHEHRASVTRLLTEGDGDVDAVDDAEAAFAAWLPRWRAETRRNIVATLDRIRAQERARIAAEPRT